MSLTVSARSFVTHLLLPQEDSDITVGPIAFGRRYEDEGVERSKFHGMLHEFEAMLTAFFVSDYIPFTGWIDKLRGLHGRLDRTFKEFDEFYQEIIDEHLDPNRQQTNEEVIVDVLLQSKNQKLFSIDHKSFITSKEFSWCGPEYGHPSLASGLLSVALGVFTLFSSYVGVGWVL
ncbi:hypothetical protein TSUD_266070 [Trifolium subterraneum]|uniref:Cytochrome P450 n=1 Tax=Trifolium subterraneum TaxID=3900 RepID=A0A2Z6MQ40_TRISU|nr:hypothetical protein TSUD_266070 [Trifolium subterraneum]